MSPTAAEIETIVRRVLSTLNGSGALPTRLSMNDRVVSVQSLKDRLHGVQVLQILPSTVLTPAAKDYCRELKIEVVREAFSVNTNAPAPSSIDPTTTTSRPQRLFVAGSVSWMNSVGKQLCSQQAKVQETLIDDATVVRSIADALRAGHQGGVAIVHSPHAACWQAARDDRLRPAVLSQWSDLTEILREVPVNVLIMSTKTWNVPSACNVARRFFQHLKNQS
jgi:hypothetical protein